MEQRHRASIRQEVAFKTADGWQLWRNKARRSSRAVSEEQGAAWDALPDLGAKNKKPKKED